jgi:hypothetical protein
MTEPLSGIDDYPKISSEIGNSVESLTDVEKRSLEEIDGLGREINQLWEDRK